MRDRAPPVAALVFHLENVVPDRRFAEEWLAVRVAEEWLAGRVMEEWPAGHAVEGWLAGHAVESKLPQVCSYLLSKKATEHPA